MPTYAYACTACDHRFEIHQSFSDDALTECPECTGRLRKLFSPVGVVFKGSGFYRTDSRSEAKASSSRSEAKASSNGSSGSTNGTTTSSGSSSAGTTPSTSAPATSQS